MTAASLPSSDGPLDDDSFAGRLKGVLTRGRIQLKQVAAALGVSPSAVHKWTRGGEIEYANLLALARFLNVNWLWLRYGDRALADLEANLSTDTRAREGRQKHLAAIMESEARMTFAQEISGVVTWEWNLLTDAVAYSPNAARLFGRPIRTLDDFWHCVAPEDAPGVQAAIAQNLAEGGVYAHESRIIPAPDTVRWIVSRATLVRDAQDRPVKMIGLSLDITERRTAEAALRDSRRRLEKVRRKGFDGFPQDVGDVPVHPTAGASVVGARPFLLAYNFDLTTPDVTIAQKIAVKIRESSGGFPYVKAIGLYLDSRKRAQVSMTLVANRPLVTPRSPWIRALQVEPGFDVAVCGLEPHPLPVNELIPRRVGGVEVDLRPRLAASQHWDVALPGLEKGILAAAGLVALSDGPEGTIRRLADDHVNARRLAEAMTEMPGVLSPGHIAQPVGERLDPARVVTNFVIFKVEGGVKRRARFLEQLERRGVLMVAYPHGQIRAVTHYGVDEADIQRTIKASADALAASA